MAYAEFYNLNQNINYPFVPTSTGVLNFVEGGTLPNALVLDCGFTVGPAIGYAHSNGAVYLQSVKRSGDNLELVFVVFNGSMTFAVTFVRDKDAEVGYTDYIDIATSPLYGVAFLVTGDIRAMYDQLTEAEERYLMSYESDGHLVTYEATVEPALVVSSKGQAIMTVNVGNLTRINDAACDGCGDVVAVDDTVQLQTGAFDLTGNIIFRGGYNVAVAASALTNSIVLSAAVGEGLGEVCNVDLVRYYGDIPEQGDRCSDFIMTINGVSPNKVGSFRLEGNGAFVVNPGTVGELIIDSRIGEQVVCADG